MYPLQRVIGGVLFFLGCILLLLQIGGASIIKLPGLELPISCFLLFFGSVLLMDPQPPLLWRQIKAKVLGPPITEEERKAFDEDHAKRRTLVEKSKGRRFLSRARWFVILAMIVVSFCLVWMILDATLMTRLQSEATLRGYLLEICEVITLQAPTSTDEMYLGRAADLVRQRKVTISAAATAIVRWIGGVLHLPIQRSSGGSRALFAASGIVVSLDSLLSSPEYKQGTLSDRRHLREAKFDWLLRKTRPDIEKFVPNKSLLPVNVGQEAKALLTLAARMEYALSDEGKEQEHLIRSRDLFQRARTYSPPLSIVFNGLGLVEFSSIKWEKRPTPECLSAAQRAYEYWLTGTRCAVSPVARSRILNNMADSYVQIISRLGKPADYEANNGWYTATSDQPVSPQKNPIGYCLLDRLGTLYQAILFERDAIQSESEDGTYYVTRAQAYALTALLLAATPRPPDCSAPAVNRMAADILDLGGKATDDRVIEGAVNRAIQDLASAIKQGYPVADRLGNAEDRKRFGLDIFDDPRYPAFRASLEQALRPS